MKLDSCGLPEDQFIEIFQTKVKFLGKLLVAFHPSAKSIMDEKIAWDMFQECLYAAEAEAEKIIDPEGKNDPYLPELYVSRAEMMNEIKAVNNKVDTLMDCLNKWQLKSK